MQLFLDLDGVLCDFIGGFKKKFGVDFHDTPEEQAWKMIKEQPNLWAELDPFPESVKFFTWVSRYDPIILTSLPKSSFIPAAQNKRKWVREHLGNVMMIPCIGGYNKAGYIQNPGDILIDDMYEKNLVPWIENGGRGIHHPEGSDHNLTYKKLIDTLYGI